jgi:methionine-rich copper-binding protein CopC
MHRRRLLLAAAVLLPATSVFALRHLKLVRSEPAANAKLSVSPAAIRLWFTQETQLAVTKVSLVRADGELMPLPALTHAPGKEEPVADGREGWASDPGRDPLHAGPHRHAVAGR